MAPHYDDDWSDSDDEEVSDVETSVQLGVPDGPLESASGRLDAAVSRIGGHPVRYHSSRHACTLVLIEYNSPFSLITLLRSRLFVRHF